MPKQLTRLTVFVSGTPETEAEKASVRRIVEELSSVLEKTHGLTLRLAVFPDTIRPGVNVDPQAEINAQTRDYDIYVGLLGARFGMSTPRAESGTEEEFNTALARFRGNSRSVRLLFYFKRAGQDPFAVDLDQLHKVKKFRERLTTQGVLYRDFRDTPDFIDTIRDNLHHLIIDEWQGDSWLAIDLARLAPDTATMQAGPSLAPLVNGPAIPTAEEDDSAEHDFGYFELAEELQESVESLSITLGRISRHTTRMGEQFVTHTRATEALTEEQRQVGYRQPVFIAKAKEIVNSAADDLEEYATELGTDTLKFREDTRRLATTLTLLLAFRSDLAVTPERQAQDRQALAGFVNQLADSRDSITSFQASVAGMPAMTGRFKRARKKVTAMLGEFLAEVQFLIAECKRILNEMGDNGSE